MSVSDHYSQDIMEQLESVGWKKVSDQGTNDMTELDITKIFKMIDVDQSGTVSRMVCMILLLR